LPTVAPIDLETLDLSRTVVTAAEIYATCRQSGRFALLDGLLHFSPGGDVVVGFKEIRADDWWAPDHIPGRPLFPGVLMIETAAQMCSFDFMRRNPAVSDAFIGFGGVDATRFRGIVEPPVRLILAARVKRLRQGMFTYEAQGFVEGKLVFQTEILGVVV
jgi:3-hydroxyacyl-[acyl-carrier-protein] dehydratase